MPDLIRVNFYRCAAEIEREFTSSRDANVKYLARSDGFNAHCTCPGFRYHHDCAHAKELFKEACGWNEEWDSRGLKPERDGHGEMRCPACGGPVAVFADMV